MLLKNLASVITEVLQLFVGAPLNETYNCNVRSIILCSNNNLAGWLPAGLSYVLLAEMLRINV